MITLVSNESNDRRSDLDAARGAHPFLSMYILLGRARVCVYVCRAAAKFEMAKSICVSRSRGAIVVRGHC